METAEAFARRLADCTRTVYQGSRAVGLRTEYKPMCSLIEDDRAAVALQAKRELLDEIEQHSTAWIPYPIREYLSELRRKYSQPGGVK